MQDTQQLLQPHMIAFIDVIGAKEISKDPIKKIELLTLLLGVHQEEQKEGYVELIENGVKAEANVTSFSDCIVISIPISKNGILWDAALHMIQQHVSRLFSRALAYNFLIRGAIEVGELYHDKHMVFGQSLVDAYLFESEKVTYPRIVLTDNCLATRKDYNHDLGILNLDTLDFNNSLPGLNPITYPSAKIFTDYDGTTCLRMMDTHLWYVMADQDPLMDFKKSIHKGKAGCESNSYLKKNWIWLERYIEKERLIWQSWRQLIKSLEAVS